MNEIKIVIKMEQRAHGYVINSFEMKLSTRMVSAQTVIGFGFGIRIALGFKNEEQSVNL